MLKLFLCLKYLRKKKIVFLSIVAVALSTALLVTVASLFTGFINAISTSASDYLGDIVIEPPVRFTHSDKLVEKLIASPDIVAASPALTASGLLHLGPGNVRAVSIWGINPTWRSEVTGLKKSLLRQGDLREAPDFGYKNSADSCFLGVGLVTAVDSAGDEYDLLAAKDFLGKSVVVTTGTFTAKDDSSPLATAKSLSKKFVVSDVIFTGVYDIDQKFVFMPTKLLAEMIYSGDIPLAPADVIHIKCAADATPAETIAKAQRIWSDFANDELNWPQFYIAQTDVITAVQKQSQYIAELGKQMGMLLLIFGVVSIGVIVLIFCIFYMIVISKLKDLAIIKSLGASPATISGIFVTFGFIVGITGAAGGIILGFFLIDNVNAIEHLIQITFGLKMWNSSVYMFDSIPSEFSWLWAGRFFVFASLASILGALVPAIVAARTIPAKILRYE
ncbi:MAG: ABC transporter permease [Anaerohalosphaeraceae bacterium]|nr:ABC transporter permease [Anaerohalosphaeraceae bacterium]